MVFMAVRARPVVLVVLAALVVVLVGPCLCALRAAETKASHDCCDSTLGLKAAVADCCTSCTVSERAPESAVPERADAAAIPSVAAIGLRIASVPFVASVSGLDTSLAPSPPTILRI